jgi:hypothetical protein
MIITFKTKRDINGNTYYLDIDKDRKTYRCDYNYYYRDTEPIIIGKRERNKLMDRLDDEGYELEC